MKNLILLLVLLVPFALLAQENNESTKKMDTETNAWMNKISSDSDMRVMMMEMMMEKASVNKTEMKKLANSIVSNPDMKRMIMAENNAETGNTGSLEPESRGMMNDSLRVKKMTSTKPVYRK